MYIIYMTRLSRSNRIAVGVMVFFIAAVITYVRVSALISNRVTLNILQLLI